MHCIKTFLNVSGMKMHYQTTPVRHMVTQSLFIFLGCSSDPWQLWRNSTRQYCIYAGPQFLSPLLFSLSFFISLSLQIDSSANAINTSFSFSLQCCKLYISTKSRTVCANVQLLWTRTCTLHLSFTAVVVVPSCEYTRCAPTSWLPGSTNPTHAVMAGRNRSIDWS